ncbi:glycosyltransferase family 2 protein [Zhenhengia yiwuensis]|uniref:Glycosyltransferase family 2 protein n=1 Tax=Zhenhengia yiwuensis TaxID=2763666 RepID=A0A926EEQ1_9FIRM|nr:glycosyltransferase family 2 protein [Zhenhengia yiwuensis]MBC8578938.1 glycosyltransferase family 2 protein [Zhenhengia yiwuensis]
MKLSIIIVNYNTYTLTKQTIDSVLEKKLPFEYEIMLVDNASMDDSMTRLQEDYKEIIIQGLLNITLNDANLGFAKANNIGMRKSKGEYLLLLNSDTYVVEECLEKCMAYIEKDKQIGALGCKVILPDGTLDHACKRGFPTPRTSFYYFLKLHKRDKVKYGLYDALHLDENEVGEVDCLMGAFMLMPRYVLDQVGLLDEDFFMYGEDIDLCYRIKEGGYKIMYYPEASIIHYKGGSSKKRRTKVIYDFHNAMWIFYKKHYIKTYSLWINSLVYVGIWTKYALEIGKNAMKSSGNKSVQDTKIQQNESV